MMSNFSRAILYFGALVAASLSIFLIIKGEYKWSGTVAMLFTAVLPWYTRRKTNYLTLKAWSLFLINAVLGLWACYYDFFTGFMYFLLAAFILLYWRNKVKDFSVITVLFVVVSLCFSMLLLVFHFMFSI